METIMIPDQKLRWLKVISFSLKLSQKIKINEYLRNSVMSDLVSFFIFLFIMLRFNVPFKLPLLISFMFTDAVTSTSVT